MSRSWTLAYQGVRPLVINAERGFGHWAKRAQAMREWRAWFWAQALKHEVPTLKAIAIDVYPHYANRKSLPDCATGAPLPSVKGAIDGLVDAGVIPDDTDKYVRSTTFHPAIIDGWEGLELVVHEVTCRASTA